jgi:hypothetical protein
MIHRGRVYADHAIVGKGELVKPLSKLGARLLEIEAAAVEKAEKPVKKEKKTRKKRAKKNVVAVEPEAEVGDAPADLI